MSRLTANLQ